MATKKIKEVNKPVAKAVLAGTGKPQQRFVAKRNIAKMKDKGWKEVGDGKDKHGRALGIRSESTDLVLMEK